MGAIRKKAYAYNYKIDGEIEFASLGLCNVFLPKSGKGDMCFDGQQVVGDKKRYINPCPYLDMPIKFCWYHLKKCHATRLYECWAEIRSKEGEQ